MKCHTVHLSHWRKVRKDNHFLLDSTTKTGDAVFAPGWDIVMGIKNQTMTEAEYRRIYTERMRQSYKDHQSHWHELFQYPSIAIGCYCTPHTFCHRYLLVNFLEAIAKKHGFEFQYQGELYCDPKPE